MLPSRVFSGEIAGLPGTSSRPWPIRHKLAVLRRHCEDVGRDYEEIERTSLGTVHLAPGEMSAEDVVGKCRDLAGAGIQHAIYNMPNVHDIEPLETFGREVIPAVAGLYA